LNTHQIATIFVPCLLNEEQKANRVNTCQDLQEALEIDPEFLLKIITSMRPVIGYNPGQSRRHISGRTHDLHAQKRQNKSAQTCQVCSFVLLFPPFYFSLHRLVHYEFVP
jgi:hypothetical protein